MSGLAYGEPFLRSRVFMDGKQIISNPGLHGPIEKCVTVGVSQVARLSEDGTGPGG